MFWNRPLRTLFKDALISVNVSKKQRGFWKSLTELGIATKSTITADPFKLEAVIFNKVRSITVNMPLGSLA